MGKKQLRVYIGRNKQFNRLDRQFRDYETLDDIVAAREEYRRITKLEMECFRQK